MINSITFREIFLKTKSGQIITGDSVYGDCLLQKTSYSFKLSLYKSNQFKSNILTRSMSTLNDGTKCPVEIVVSVSVEIDIKEGIMKVANGSLKISTIKNLTFKQRYKQPIKKLVKILNQCEVTGYNVVYTKQN